MEFVESGLMTRVHFGSVSLRAVEEGALSLERKRIAVRENELVPVYLLVPKNIDGATVHIHVSGNEYTEVLNRENTAPLEAHSAARVLCAHATTSVNAKDFSNVQLIDMAVEYQIFTSGVAMVIKMDDVDPDRPVLPTVPDILEVFPALPTDPHEKIPLHNLKYVGDKTLIHLRSEKTTASQLSEWFTASVSSFLDETISNNYLLRLENVENKDDTDIRFCFDVANSSDSIGFKQLEWTRVQYGPQYRYQREEQERIERKQREQIRCKERERIQREEQERKTLSSASFPIVKEAQHSIECCDRAIAIDENDAIAWRNKGGALHELKRYEEETVVSI